MFKDHDGSDKLVFYLSASFLLAFVLLSALFPASVKQIVDISCSFATRYFGAFWQFLLLASFFVGIGLCLGRSGSVRLGKKKKPDLSSFEWLSLIMCTLLAGGGVFWAAGEPLAHFISPPPVFSPPKDDFSKAVNALTLSYMHWGFLAWAIIGGLGSITLIYLHYEKGLPLKPRTLLYPVFGKRVIEGLSGSVIDALCIVAAAAGTIGPIGFLGLQVSYGLNLLFGIKDGFSTQMIIILCAMSIYILSSLRGLSKGLNILSKYNVYLVLALMLFILFFGPSSFIFDVYVQGVGNYLQNLLPMATYRANEAYLATWTLFFWGWFIGYAPLMAIFIARVSRGRSVRELILSISIFAPLVTMFWFSIVGGAGLAFEIETPGVISKAYEGFNLPAALLAISSNLPFPYLISTLFLLLSTVFIITTGDSMTYSMSVVINTSTKPSPYMRAFWGLLMGAVAIMLIYLGKSSITALQSFIIITAVPVSLIMLPTLWVAPRLVNTMANLQNLK